MLTILQVAIPLPFYHYFDYLAPLNFPSKDLKKGLRVCVPFGKNEKIGLLMGVGHTTKCLKSQLKSAVSILDDTPLFPQSIQTLLEWTSRYYHYPMGKVIFQAIPNLLRRGKIINNDLIITAHVRRKKTKNIFSKFLIEKTLLNSDQQAATDTIIRSLNRFQPFLLNGVTGSGKTEVYLEVIKAVLQRGKQALVLVPEVGLTPQMLARFQARFPASLGLFHSRLTDKQRLEYWLLARCGKVSVVIGTRSALFMPLLNPGIIIVDEEHDASFKQQKGVRYHARDLALVRARLESIPIILGSATASLESIFNATQQRYKLLDLPKRAGLAQPPKIRLVDLRNQKLEEGLSHSLLQAIKRHLSNKTQVLLFLNRRGYSPLIICHSCGWIAECPYCSRKMTFHKNPSHLQCHYCGHHRFIDAHCPACKSCSELVALGYGTQRLEQTLKKHFPNTTVLRIDRDNTRQKGSLSAVFKKAYEGENQILLGTQMLAKGHHFPKLSLVGILEADNQLFSADFRSLERTAQLLTQVSGRAGRASHPGEVVIQTYHSEHPFLTRLLEQGYFNVSKFLLQEREAAMFPPYSHLALLHAESRKESYPINFLNEIKNHIQQAEIKVSIWGPVPSFLARRAGYYRYQLLLQANQRSILHSSLDKIIKSISLLGNRPRVRWALDVDPTEL